MDGIYLRTSSRLLKMKDLLGRGTQEVLASGLAARLGKEQAGYERQGAHMLVGQDHAGGRLEHPVQGLITIIPIAGWIATTGWLMLAFENARSGRNELPAAGFHLGRGIGIFGVFFLYGLVLGIPGIVYNSIGAHTVSTTQGSSYSTGSPLGSVWSLASQLFIDFLAPTLIIMVY